MSLKMKLNNYGGCKMKHKIKVKLTGQDGNIFSLVGVAAKALRKNKRNDEAKKMTSEVWDSESYDEALSIISNYCEIS